ncbi:formate--tetrahydrofolate ligase [Mesotoga sp. Brook.08.YT.4.2.5.1]|uniref:formate--tetrahydrofolate ligase n=1 Tax=unclassified Mesotoga TaxID=1184398 RepID=UPI000C1922AC|nr:MULTISPECIES: formate--tetrahydrofolate ligase [unclassified Mesotoga]PNQ05794.1 formate--tetrahydrofolate ligase [Mesotoga sp. SC_NapDC3]PXF35045.1 formate--tetrahydrofolate ligase [Mesotoga sp. SC_NapDC]PNE19853.1 formate--tetrahydrofolate ligase [Mesotoga sp. Brook.08.YT.4.2.5.1]PVD18183.1 formate--tetrahydrofolate ligase [Mesotoga sp. Brook.08.105.5.1]RAO96518.1 formate--tetrahydrofolate ligase [Mesotoga sp. Brook.08.YT.4.2.5.4.]
MLTDLEIAQKAELREIDEVASSISIPDKHLRRFGKYVAKISHLYLNELQDRPDGKLVLVTAISPTSAGEGKTTTSVGLAMALNKIGKKTFVTLREPSVGPIMGIKGGAAGGGYSQVLPMEEINLHFTGDFHAVSMAHNLLSAVIDAHINFKNELKIDPTQIYWPRTMDMNDRALRQIIVGLGGSANGYPREDSFVITAASEIMAIICLSKNLVDLKERLSKIIVARSYDGEFITVEDLDVQGAMATLLKDVLDPNLVQTLEGTPAFVHGGPFANIAHGTNTLTATKMALKLSDCVITEAGFGADLGAQKFLDFVCQVGDLNPSAVVLVASIRALKLNGGASKNEIQEEDIESLNYGFKNLKVHFENLRKYGIPVVVALNEFPTDTAKERETFDALCKADSIPYELSKVWAEGGAGGIDLAKKLLEVIDQPNSYKPLIPMEAPFEERLEKLAKEIYRAGRVDLEPAAKSKLRLFKKKGLDRLPIIVAKTQYSISDDDKKLGAPEGYTFKVRDLNLSAGAGFIVVVAGKIMLMPGLGKDPNAKHIDIDADGKISGLF